MGKINKSIRIITFHSAYSYGAVLQTFALWKYLDGIYSDVKVVDFAPPTFSLKFNRKRPITWIKTWRFRFRNKIAKTKPYTADGLRKTSPQADVYIIGSDQVWNPEITGIYKDIYFGDFIPRDCEKISYASSWGKEDFSEQTLKEIAPLFHDFKAVSVREESGVKLCREVAGVDALCVLDPTLLIEDYTPYFRKTRLKKELCLFVLDNDKEDCFDTSRFVANELGLKPKVLNKARKLEGFKNIPFPSIPAFLREIHNSEFVITNSFHGLAFSIIFNKQFAFVCTNKGNSTRIKNLLSKTGLTRRMFDSYEALERSRIWEEPIDYSEVNRRLNTLRTESKNYLTENINQPSQSDDLI